MVKDVFVNPYSFVPLPAEVVRRPFYGHDGRSTEPGFSGWIDVEWRLETPLLLPANADAEKWIRADGSINLPGSSLKGAVRSLHEALFNGCLRIVDEDFVPSYRNPAGKPDDEDLWRLAIVLADKGGTPTSLQLTAKSSEQWVDATSLANAWPKGRVPTNGDIVHIRGTDVTQALDRTEVRQVSGVDMVHARDAAPTEEGALFPVGQVLLPTDTSARHKFRRDRSRGRAYWAVATLTDETAALDIARAECRSGLEEFTIACSGSNDRRLLERDRNEPGVDTSWRSRTKLEPVKWWTTSGTFDTVARRVNQSGYLYRGDVVWARVESGYVTGLRLAQLWRAAGSTKVGQRIGDSGPCLSGKHSEKDGLCLTCSIFGGVDTGGTRRGQGDQISYAGHVRFGSARSAPSVKLRQVDLAPLGSPNPGSGMFYLRMPGDVKPGPTNAIASHWGSETDTPRTVVAGRKFYWHGDPDAQAAHWSRELGRPQSPRYRVSDDQRKGKLWRTAKLVPAGTTLSARITVDQLPKLALESLLDALDPSRILALYPGDNRQIAVRLGGGKPLGFGSATPTVVGTHLQPTRDRYAVPQASVGAWVSAEPRVRAPQLIERVGRFTANLPYLVRLLDRGGLGEMEPYLSYPPGDTWDRLDSKGFRESFEFFQQVNGQRLASTNRPWRPLPRPTPGTSVELPITLRRRGR